MCSLSLLRYVNWTPEDYQQVINILDDILSYRLGNMRKYLASQLNTILIKLAEPAKSDEMKEPLS